MSTHNLCFEKKYEKNIKILICKLSVFGVKFSVYLNRHVFVMHVVKNEALLCFHGDIRKVFISAVNSSLI